MTEPHVLRLSDIDLADLRSLLDEYQLQLVMNDREQLIIGSYWGDSEAGLVGRELHARPDTPLHSVLHEAGHYICMDPQRRGQLHTDAGGDDLEECGVCYLQVKLWQSLPGQVLDRCFADMDAWGYSFRLGSSQRWFENDASDAREWLQHHGLLDARGELTGQRRAC